MARGILKMVTAALAATAFATAANAGGYSRGSASLDPLLEDGIAFSSGLVVVAPSRGYATINGVPASAIPTPGGGNASEAFTETYVNFGATAAFDVIGGVRCAGSYAQPYGAKTDYGYSQLAPLVGGLTAGGSTTSAELSSHELGATCSYAMDVGPGKLHFLGGLFYQMVDYQEKRAFGFGSAFNGGDVSLDDGAFGYRFGAAYTIPQYAVNASLVYRSAVDHRAEGVTRAPAIGGIVPSFADVTTPQSVKLSVQSGVAPGWLVFGSVEWTDWSVIQQVQVFANPGTLAPIAVPITGVTIDGFFRDGWTITGGVGHAFTEKLAGSVSVTWDSGVSKGANISSFSDTWTFAAGGRYNLTEKVSLRGGLAYTILTSATENQIDGDVITYGTDSAIAGGLQLVGKF
jgi:long-chain fatty acid transport protein